MSQISPNSLLQIAVVGHTNGGKTSLLRTLTRRVDFGEVSDRPGTTRHVEAVDLRIDGQASVRFYDTPGLEDAVSLLVHLQAIDGATSRQDRVRRFLDGPEAHGVFEQEAKVLRKLLEVDAAFLVIDTREPVLPKFRDEIELLNACARPILPVLNFIRDAASRESAWRALLMDGGLHAIVRFDAAAPFTGAERDLYQDLGTLLPANRSVLRDIVTYLEQEFDARRAAACKVIAGLLVDVAAMRRTASVTEFEQPRLRQAHIDALRQTVFNRAQRSIDELLLLYGFRESDAAEAPLPEVQGRLDLDLFNVDALLEAGTRLGKGVAMGAAVGVVADLALAGLSLGAGVALGSTIGGALSQGLNPLARKIANWFNGITELSVEDPVLMLLAQRQLSLLQALESRGHAATQRVATGDAINSIDAPERIGRLAKTVELLQSARGHPQWETPQHADSTRRRELVDAVAMQLKEHCQIN